MFNCEKKFLMPNQIILKIIHYSSIEISQQTSGDEEMIRWAAADVCGRTNY
jgi:hypothetical protein